MKVDENIFGATCIIHSIYSIRKLWSNEVKILLIGIACERAMGNKVILPAAENPGFYPNFARNLSVQSLTYLERLQILYDSVSDEVKNLSGGF